MCLHLPFKVDKDGGQVAVGVVGDAGGRDGFEELGLRKLPGQSAQVLVDERTQGDAGKHERRGKSRLDSLLRNIQRLQTKTSSHCKTRPVRLLHVLGDLPLFVEMENHPDAISSLVDLLDVVLP